MGGHLPPVACIPQKRIAAREDASVAHEKAALAGAAELEARVAAFDSKEKKALRVSMLSLWRQAAPSDAAFWQHPALQEGLSLGRLSCAPGPCQPRLPTAPLGATALPARKPSLPNTHPPTCILHKLAPLPVALLSGQRVSVDALQHPPGVAQARVKRGDVV